MAETVVTFTDGSDEVFRKELLLASAKFYGSDADKNGPIAILSAQATLMLSVLWNSFRRVAPHGTAAEFRALVTQGAQIVASGQHIIVKSEADHG